MIFSLSHGVPVLRLGRRGDVSGGVLTTEEATNVIVPTRTAAARIELEAIGWQKMAAEMGRLGFDRPINLQLLSCIYTPWDLEPIIAANPSLSI